MPTTPLSTEAAEALSTHADTWTERLIIVFVIVVVALILTVVAQILIHKLWGAKREENMPSPSIISNVAKFTIWVVAFTLMLKPIFGVQPTALAAALGAGGIAFSFALKDTLANLISGLQLTGLKLIIPGDYVRINNIQGVVRDITWRQTTVVNRIGEEVSVPNAVLNTSALEKLPHTVEAFTSIPLVFKHGIDHTKVVPHILQVVQDTVGDKLLDTEEPSVIFKAFTPYGIQGEIWLFLAPGHSFNITKSQVIEALINEDYLASFEPTSVPMLDKD